MKKNEVSKKSIKDLDVEVVYFRGGRFGDYLDFTNYPDVGYPEAGDTADIGDFKFVANPMEGEPEYFEIPNCSGSDYSGSTVSKANYDGIYEDFSSEVISVSGGHNSYGLYAPVDVSPELYEVVKRMENYSVYDDDALSTNENELQTEYLNDYVLSEVNKRLESKYDDELEELGFVTYNMLDDDGKYVEMPSFEEVTPTLFWRIYHEYSLYNEIHFSYGSGHENLWCDIPKATELWLEFYDIALERAKLASEEN